MTDRPVVVVGAGMAGLCAAHRLRQHGWPVTVIEAAGRPGGRLCTFAMGAATLDVGAQFFTARSDDMRDLAAGMVDAGVAYEWCRGFGAEADGHPRYAGTGGMARVAEHLAAGLDVRYSTPVAGLTRRPDHWAVSTESGPAIEAAAVILTAPAPEARLLAPGVPDIKMTPVLAVLVVLDGPSALTGTGALQQPDAQWSWVADNSVKGISAVPALTLHASPASSTAQWHAEDHELIAAARPFAGGSRTVASRVWRWRHATPVEPHPDRFVVVAPGLVVAGDGFGGPKVEGAAQSGWAAAQAVMSAK